MNGLCYINEADHIVCYNYFGMSVIYESIEATILCLFKYKIFLLHKLFLSHVFDWKQTPQYNHHKRFYFPFRPLFSRVLIRLLR